MNDDIAAMAEIVAAHPDYEVIRRLVPQDVFRLPDGIATQYGLILDTETTGLIPGIDQIIEIALLLFEYDPESGHVYGVTEVYCGLEDPGMPISPEAAAVNGITDAMVAGQQIDDATVVRLAETANIVIAHRCEFDRPFTEGRFPGIFERLPWVCSLSEIKWKAHGFGSGALEFLAYRHGFFGEKHRADADCRTLLEVIRQQDATGETFLKTLIARARANEYCIWATGSPFERKDPLKERGYRFDGPSKTWFVRLPKEKCRAECDWLRDHIYDGRLARIKLDTLGATDRFSRRVTTTQDYRLPARQVVTATASDET